MTKIFLWVMAGILAACGSAPVARLPQALEQAQSSDKEARRALKNGDLLRAQREFAKTLQRQQSLDETSAAAMTLINLATVTHQLHDDQGALIWLNKILLENSAIYSVDSHLLAAFRKAVILTNLGRLDEAESALTQAEKLCENKCTGRFGINGLHARLQLLKGDTVAALTTAQSVSKQTEADKEEQANALRIVAAAEEKLTRYADALQHFQDALGLDKVLGLSERISEDLNGMARTAKQLGRDRDAVIYYQRAELVPNPSFRLCPLANDDLILLGQN